MLKEFRDFLMRGNLIELAVAFVMGGAFATVVNSLVADLIMPIIAAIGGQSSFDSLDFTINDSVFRYGAFITSLVSFVIIAAAIFFVVKPASMTLERLKGKEEEAVPDEERRHQELLAALRTRG